MTVLKVDLNLPWSCEENGTAIIDADGHTAAYGLSSDETPEIVRAVNNYEALVTMTRRVAATTGLDGNARAMRLDAQKLLALLNE